MVPAAATIVVPAAAPGTGATLERGSYYELSYRLPNWTPATFRKLSQALEYREFMRNLGCQVGLKHQGDDAEPRGPFQVSVRLSDWVKQSVTDPQKARELQDWLTEAGFETRLVRYD